MLNNQEALILLQQSELIVSADKVQAAVVRVANEINNLFAGKHPLVLSVMGGAVVFTRAVTAVA